MNAKLLSLTLALGLSAPAFANPPARPHTPVVRDRQVRQQARIADGVNDGSLTPREAARLERGQARVQAAKLEAKADGVVTKHERRELDRMQDRQSARIARQKHDAQDRR